jgi:ubiquinone/menaquinone biosynthesis C-methylase UbiE
MKMNLREYMFRAWYWYVNNRDKNAEVLFMNYGYSDDGQQIDLRPEDENDRYSIQLYHHLVAEVDIENKDILEVGCGRGGGLAYIVRSAGPSTAKGIDLDGGAVDFCNEHYSLAGLSFAQGDAQDLHVEDNSCDVLMNVESSHRYTAFHMFLNEVKRALRSKGYFLYADFRCAWEMNELQEQIEQSGLTIFKKQIITGEVVKALELDDRRKRELVKKLVPSFLSKVALNFAATVGSETYNRFDSGKYEYYSYILRKD